MVTRQSMLINRLYVSSCVNFNEQYAVNNPTELLDSMNQDIFDVSENGFNCVKACFDFFYASAMLAQNCYSHKNGVAWNQYSV